MVLISALYAEIGAPGAEESQFVSIRIRNQKNFNQKDMSRFCNVYPNLGPVRAGATRRGLALDEIYTNVNDDSIADKLILKPLSKRNGVESDHDIIAVSCKLPKHRKATVSRFSFRPITSEGVAKFGEMLKDCDWRSIKSQNASVSALKLDEILRGFIEASFPLKERKIKSTDAPWFNKRTKKAVVKKMRIYKAEGKSER